MTTMKAQKCRTCGIARPVDSNGTEESECWESTPCPNMKEQPQKRERPTHFSAQRNGYTIAVFSYSDAMEYFDHLEQENTALKERVAELEKENRLKSIRLGLYNLTLKSAFEDKEFLTDPEQVEADLRGDYYLPDDELEDYAHVVEVK